MTSISNWYNNQYSTWNRTRRLSATPYLARTNTNTSRTATAMIRNNAAQEAVANMGDLSNLTNNKKQDTLFGPNIGVVASGPAWTETNKKKSTGDQLTPEVVKGWIAKSKEASQPTTTLQALVNLKRPTLRLSPLSPAPSDDSSQTDSHDHHGLEFEYDCDAPKCGIYVHVLLSSDHHHADSSDKTGLSRVLIFETVVEGGFGKILKLEEGATLELDRLERQPAAHPEDPSVSGTGIDGRADTPGLPGVSDEAPRKSRRFTHFHFRKRDQDREVAGPALAVVDAEIGTAVVEGDKDKDKDSKEQVGDGVKVIIQLVALGGEGKPLSSPNEQATYLHVVRMGVAPVEGEDDLRQWVVKVVKREATIGPHTFHLHEIYGLSSQSSSPSKPVASVPTSPTTTEVESHVYPPTATSPTLPTSVIREEEPSSECLLCLSSPREVVLLPCRHLVACKDCALNMVEFGAGGNIVQPEEPVAPTGDAAAEGAQGSSAEPAVAAPAAPIVANPARRKRKAKGWFCPVCRQPYTSLLRITTTSLAKEKDIDKRTSTSTEGIELTTFTAATTTGVTTPGTPSRGALSSLRPAFLRGISRGSTTALADTLPPDLERGEALPA
jgi:hypothetical protein